MAIEVEPNGSIAAANTLTSGVFMSGQSSTPADYDYFRLYSPSVGTVQFTLTLPSTNYSNYYVTIYDLSLIHI